MINDSLPLTILTIVGTAFIIWLLHQLLMGFFMGDEAVSEVIARRRAARSYDDLTQIEGIGPKIQGILNDAGYSTFADIATSEASELKDVLLDAGNRYKVHDPATWPQQAGLAQSEEWEKLEKLQDKLDGGRK